MVCRALRRSHLVGLIMVYISKGLFPTRNWHRGQLGRNNSCACCALQNRAETLRLRSCLLPVLDLLPNPEITGRGGTVLLLGIFQKCIDSYCTSLILWVSRFPCPGKFSGSVSLSKILEAIINSEEKNLEKAPKGRRKCKYCCHDIFNSNIKVCKKL